MPRLIDANALIENIKRVYCTGCNNYDGVRCKACGTDDALDMIDDAPSVEHYGNIDISANAVLDVTTREDQLRFRETDEMCPRCQRDLEVYYCENRTYIVRCKHCHIVMLVQARNPDEAAAKVGLHVKPVRHGRWIRYDNTYTRYMCSECQSKNHGGHENYCPFCGAKMMEVRDEV